ncbi:MAG TPA: type II toxin-antitoxin system VapB family antitoxin [Vicinamibacterales bacterium]|nr:type II toxin-antitoxin system VapB family antitoxin [Vicinamibacterales bacterium]
MRTTLDVDDRLLREAKKRAAERGESLTRVVEDALRVYLHPPRRTGKPFRLTLLVKRGRALPGVDWDDRDSIYERMEGRS